MIVHNSLEFRGKKNFTRVFTLNDITLDSGHQLAVANVSHVFVEKLDYRHKNTKKLILNERAS